MSELVSALGQRYVHIILVYSKDSGCTAVVRRSPTRRFRLQVRIVSRCVLLYHELCIARTINCLVAEDAGR